MNALVLIQSFGRECQTHTCDLSQRDEVLDVVPELRRLGRHVDIFVHCAGLQHRCAAEDFPDDKWDDILSVNLTSGFQLSRELAKDWLENELDGYAKSPAEDQQGMKKKILMVASMMTFTGGVEIPAYAASKGAVGQLTKALNNEWMGKGINVNAIAPGYIETELTAALKDGGEKERKILERIPAGRWGQPYDLAGAVIYLCSKAGDYVGGEIHAVDGGFLAR